MVLAALAAGVSAWLITRPGPRRRRGTRPLPPATVIRIACAGVGALIALVVGGMLGVAIGIALALFAPRWLGRMESRSQRRRREALERQAPVVADLLAACLVAGATAVEAVRAVTRALGEPVSIPLTRLTGALDLGADPVAAWTTMSEEPTLRPIARAAARSAQTGAPLAALLTAVADDQRDEARARAESMARAAGVRSVAPLAACFLPAFLLIGVVPVVASLATPLVSR